MADDENEPNEQSGRNREPLGESPDLDPARHYPAGIRTDRGPVVLVGTKKGAFFLSADRDRKNWSIGGPVFLGHIVHHIVLDPRDRRTLLMGIRTGHLGPTVYRSTDLGVTWSEATRPPAFPKASEGEKGRVVEQVFWLTAGHKDEVDTWYAGTSPEGLFQSRDGGNTWTGIAGWNDNPNWEKWTVTGGTSTPDGSPLHSVRIDPRDARHLYLAVSAGGVFESLDAGAEWRPLNEGVEANFLPDPYPEYGQDTHNMDMHPLDPDVLYQQNHCGIYRIVRPSDRWERIGDNMPAEIGDIGFPVALHPRDSNVAWVFPMNGSDVWPRTSPDGKPAVYATLDAGKTWLRQDSGLPPSQAWFTVYRQAMTVDTADPVGVYFGTTNGEVWASADEGREWKCIASHLPHIYSVTVAEFGA